MKICGHFFRGGGGGGSLRNRTFLGGRSFLYILRLFKVKIQNGNIFWGRKISNYLGIPDILDLFISFFGGGG